MNNKITTKIDAKDNLIGIMRIKIICFLNLK